MISLIITSTLLGIGLAMDAFSVSLANGLSEPKMKKGRVCYIAGVFGVFQWAMPIAGWVCIHTILGLFQKFEKFIPWIALLLLLYIGGEMLVDGIKNKDVEETDGKKLDFKRLMIQGVATSIDALSVGFAIAEYDLLDAMISTVIIGILTFIICVAGLELGKKFGTKLAGKAAILGGIVLILIGLEIFVRGVFF